MYLHPLQDIIYEIALYAIVNGAVFYSIREELISGSRNRLETYRDMTS